MRVLLPLSEVDAAGIGTLVRGLRAALPAALGDGEELVVVDHRAPARRGEGGVDGEAGPRPLERLARFAHEQAVVARAARRADAVHLAEPRPLLLSGTPAVVTVNDVFFLDHPEWYPPAVARFKRLMLSATVARRPAVMVCISEHTRERLLAHHPRVGRGDLRVIHPGLTPPPPSPADAAADEEEAEPFLLTVATIDPRKNHLGLLEAYRRARAEGLRHRWKVAGAPGYGAEPIVRALRAAAGVDVLGRVDDEERERLYRGASFLAAPSHAEGFGYPPLEAMARGVPVVCARGSASDETAGEAALRVAPGDAEGWTRALLTLAGDGARRRALIEAGRRQAARFSWDEAARRYVEAYRAAAGA